MAAARVSLIELLKRLFPLRDEKDLFAEILRGGVMVQGRTVLKPGVPVAADAEIVVREKAPYVSRGGEKLAAALARWSLDCAGKVWVDAGCSTGGFTDCLLQHGAALVHAIDVGENVLDWRVRSHPRVRVHEGVNIMAVGPGALQPAPECAVADLSFRSLRKAAAHILSLTRGAWGIFLVKPQFEYQSPPETFHGVVSDPAVLRVILRELLAALGAEGVYADQAMPSPLTGRKGNQEFLFLFRSGKPRAAGETVELPEGLLGE
jgi:23S rRNA (cytidine1920-2'-O)/16S rRNA (cytidine1409-2'-O)-methyltransferase